MIDEYLQKWIIKADNDLKVAEHEMNIDKDGRITEAICFHCQQAVEKYLKAFLRRCDKTTCTFCTHLQAIFVQTSFAKSST